MSETAATTRSFQERLDAEGVICAGGYLFELERRGYLQAGTFVPEVALENPDALAQLHRDFLRCGSDVVLAFTYNGHREKMRIIGKEELLEPLNRSALRTARQVALEWDGAERPLVAGNISNTNIYDPADPDSKKQVRAMFEEMVGWAAEEGVDFIQGETFYFAEEAEIAIDVIRAHGLPGAIHLGLMGEGVLRDGLTAADCAKRLADYGADVVGMNCFRGPATMMPYLKEIREAVSAHVSAVPVPYRTTETYPTFFNLPDPGAQVPAPHGRPFPTALDPLFCNRYEVRAFAEEAWSLGMKFQGICCGAAPIHIREVAEGMGRTTVASRYTPDMSKHFLYGSDDRLKATNTAYGDRA